MNPDFRDLLAAFNVHGVECLIDGVEFAEAWKARVEARVADQDAAVLSREHLVTNKRAAGREQDLLDVKWLERTAQKKH